VKTKIKINQVKVNTVYKTNDYSLFSKLDGNRNINKAHFVRLKKSIQEQSLCVPIIVNEEYKIIDGQHRFESWKSLMLPVYYIVVEGYGLKEIQRINANSMNWKMMDYAESYCDLGNKHYCRYKEFKGKYNLGDYESISMLQGNENGSGKNFDRFRSGLFQVKRWKKACDEAEKIIKIKEFYDGYKRRTFVFAILKFLSKDNFDYNRMLQKIKKYPNMLKDCTNKEQYMMLLEKMYNYNQPEKSKISLIYN
tara:strand:- start:769 stop:1521 length:753 start_codon:yes stop_codon:yes gene_type:complete